MRDFAEYPELVWMNKNHWVPPLSLAVLCYAIGGFAGLVWGFAVSTTLLWHATYSVNSIAHIFGRRRYETSDTSRNNWLVALLTFGEGWHNNHHYYMASVRQGFYWWEVDLTYYVLRALAAVGVVWDLRLPTAEIRDGGNRRLKQAAKRPALCAERTAKPRAAKQTGPKALFSSSDLPRTLLPPCPAPMPPTTSSSCAGPSRSGATGATSSCAPTATVRRARRPASRGRS
jgi:hypothetical protein